MVMVVIVMAVMVALDVIVIAQQVVLTNHAHESVRLGFVSSGQ